MLDLELERGAVVDVVSDVLFVGQNLVDGATGPWPVDIVADTFPIEPEAMTRSGIPPSRNRE
jgi:hypothetical protein